MQFLVVFSLMGTILVSLAMPVLAADEGTGTAGTGTVQSGGSTPTGESSGETTGGSSGGTTGGSAPAVLFPLPSASQYGNLPAPTQGKSAQYQFQELMWGLIMNVRYIIGAVAIAFCVYSGFRMVTAFGNEEVYGKQRNNLLYAVIGLAVVGMSGEFAKIFAVSCPDFTAQGQVNYTCTQGGFLKDPNSIIRASTIFNNQTKIIITFIKYFIGGVAVLMIVRNGMSMITMGSNEEHMGQDKKNLAYSALGLILIIIADNVISNVFYKLDLTRYPSVGGAKPGIDSAQGIKEIVGVTNFIVSVVGPLAILMLLAGGIMYMTAAGKEEQMNKAKKLIVMTLVGIIIIYGAFAIVSTFIGGNVGEPATDVTTTQALLNSV
jgi:hypothetical protein